MHSFFYLLCFDYTQQWLIKEVCWKISLSSILQLVFCRGHQLLICFSIACIPPVNCLSFMSRWPLIIFSVGLSVISGIFQNRSSFHFWSLSTWPATFSFALEVLFLPLTSFTMGHANRDFLPNIWFHWFGLGYIQDFLRCFSLFYLIFLSFLRIGVSCVSFIN